ncbi:MAG: hypothetical protein GX931_00595 [Acholeplasmataceae bacterium]|nr:hypothetical protein [Acholeplasmataceae bacterium]
MKKKRKNTNKIILYAYACLFPVGSLLFLIYGIIFLTRPKEITNTILTVVCFVGSLVFLIVFPYIIKIVKTLLKLVEEDSFNDTEEK